MLKQKINIHSIRKLSNLINKPKWKSVVGLEIHAQIQSNSKLFSGAKVAFAAPVNSCVSPFDASIPGTLPVLNKKCVEAGVRTALALSCEINPISMFDRKHYFYADLPAGYQITQQRQPLARNGELSFHVFVPGITKKPYRKSSRIHQLQLEQDSGKSLHDLEFNKSLLDLNRAGVALMELVFQPDLSTGEEAAALVKELQLILTRLGTCSCKMEEGALRVDANISIHREGEPLGVRTEVKNIGSVRGVADAITYEIQRQINLVNSGGRVHNETRSWDSIDKCTIPMRDKEVEQDYRFMPEPNLPPLHLNVNGTGGQGNDLLIDVNALKLSLPEMPEETRQKLVTNFNLTQDMAIILMNIEKLLQHFYEIQKINTKIPAKMITNFLINDFLTQCNKSKIDLDKSNLESSKLAELLTMLHDEMINLNLARLILQKMLEMPMDTPLNIAKTNNWMQIKDPEEITRLCLNTLQKNPKLVEQFKNGKTKIIFALAGEIAKLTEQKANMALVVEKLTELLKKS